MSLVYCDNCGTRLVDDAASGQGQERDDDEGSKHGSRSQPFSLPARPPGQTGDLDVSAELPDWLKTGDFSGDFAQDGLEDQELDWIRSAQEEDEWTDEEAPTLEELSGDHAPRDDLPTWLLDEDTDGAIFSGEKSTDELFMASLADEEDEVDDQATLPPAAESQAAEQDDATSELHGWLADMEGDYPQVPDAGDNEPDEAEAPPPPEPQELEEDDFLKWLSEIQQEALAEEDEKASLETDATARASTEPFDAPDWLAVGDEQARAEGVSDAEDEAADVETPDWLRDLGDESASDESSDIFAGSEMEAPEWLVAPLVGQDERSRDAGEPQSEAIDESGGYDAGQVTSVQETGALEGSQEDEFLQWLNSVGRDNDAAQDAGAMDSVSAADTQLETPHDDIDATPPYVSGSEVETEEDAFARSEALQESDYSDAEEYELAALSFDADSIELPEWITGVTAELELDDEPAAAGEEEQGDEADDVWSRAASDDVMVESGPALDDGAAIDLDDQQVTSEDLPDWFSDILKDIDVREERQASQSPSPELDNVPQQLAGAELPDWLDSPFVDETAAEPTPLEEIPEWLRAPLRERLARAAEERGLNESALDRGDEWRELLEAPLNADEVSVHRDKDAVPAWLESIRSAANARAAGAETDKRDEDPVGPMRGIAGAIEIAPVVAQATHRERPAASAVSSEQENQALLLRQLAHLQQDATRTAVPAPGGAGTLSPLTRLLLAILLLVATVVGLTAGRLWPDVASATSSDSSEAVLPATLNGSAGQSVLLVFDYSPATMDVLEPSAQKLLQGIADQGGVALVASQSASGLALARSAVERSSLSEITELGLIPGGALGVRRLGQCLEAGSTCESLFGQPVDQEMARQLVDSSHVIVITGDRDNLLAWVEQLDTPGSISLSAVVTPALRPVASPYAASGQLVELTVAEGRTGAASSTDLTSTSTALVLSRLLVATAMFAGAVYYLFTGLSRSRRA